LTKKIAEKTVTVIKKAVNRIAVVQKGLLAAAHLFLLLVFYLQQAPTSIMRLVSRIANKTLTNLLRVLRKSYLHTAKNRRRFTVTLVMGVLFSLNLLFLTIISGQLFIRTSVRSYGSIQIQSVDIAVYQDASCTTTLTSVPWGTLLPGSSATKLIYLRNEGSTPLTLSLSAADWNPSNAGSYMSLSWNYNGQTVSPGQVIQLAITLSVSPNISGISSFSFDIVIDGTG